MLTVQVVGRSSSKIGAFMVSFVESGDGFFWRCDGPFFGFCLFLL